MPNRILREGIITSERVERLSEGAEIFYRRVHSVVDDYGRYYAKAELLRAACYPLRLDKVRNDDIETYKRECCQAKLMLVKKTLKGVEIIELSDFRQQIRSHSKFACQGDNHHKAKD